MECLKKSLALKRLISFVLSHVFIFSYNMSLIIHENNCIIEEVKGTV